MYREIVYNNVYCVNFYWKLWLLKKLHFYRSTLPSRSRRLHHHTITEETDDRDHGLKRPSPLVTTQFVEWSCKRFAQPVNAKDKLKDVESTAYHEREWRFLRLVFKIFCLFWIQENLWVMHVNLIVNFRFMAFIY